MFRTFFSYLPAFKQLLYADILEFKPSYKDRLIDFFIYVSISMVLVADITGNRVISYDITLPIPSWLAVTRIGFSDAIRSLALSIFTLPFGLPFVWNQFNPSMFSPCWFGIFLIANALFFGFFSMLLASTVKNINYLESMWMRVIFPLMTLGTFQFGVRRIMKRLDCV